MANKALKSLKFPDLTDTYIIPTVIPFGACDSSSTSTAFTATVPGITELADGVCVYLENGVATSELGATLNINGLGAKEIYISQGIVTAIGTQWNAAHSALFIYNSTRVDGGCWDFFYGYDSNTTYTPPKLGFGYATCSTGASTAAKTASLSNYNLTAGGIVSVKFTNAVGANATLNINSKGAVAIYYRGSAITAGVIEAGDTATFIYSTSPACYHLIALDKVGGSITVDSALSNSSTNPVQNKVVNAGLDELDEKIDALNDSRTYAMPFSIKQTGKYINYSTGEVGSGANYDYTDYVDVSMCSNVIYRRAKTTVASTSVGLAFYDSTKTFIQNSGEQIESGQAAVGYAGLKQIDVPSTAVYARFSTLHDTTTYGDFELYGLYKTPVVDSALSSTSKNPVQNKVVKAGLEKIQVQQWIGPGGGWYGFTTIDATGNDDPICFPDVNMTTGLISYLVLPEATQSVKGAMTATDKTKVDKLVDGIKEVPNSNLFNTVGFVDDYLIDASGEEVYSAGFKHTNVIPAIASHSYLLTGVATSATSAWHIRIHAYIDGVWSRQLADVSVSSSGGNISQSVTLSSTENGIVVNIFPNRLVSYPTLVDTTVKGMYVSSNQGSGNAGKFLVVGSDGTVTPTTLATWQATSY